MRPDRAWAIYVHKFNLLRCLCFVFCSGTLIQPYHWLPGTVPGMLPQGLRKRRLRRQVRLCFVPEEFSTVRPIRPDNPHQDPFSPASSHFRHTASFTLTRGRKNLIFLASSVNSAFSVEKAQEYRPVSSTSRWLRREQAYMLP